MRARRVWMVAAIAGASLVVAAAIGFVSTPEEEGSQQQSQSLAGNTPRMTRGSSSEDTYLDSLRESNEAVATLADAKELIGFSPVVPSDSTAGELKEILVDAELTNREGEVVGERQPSERAVYLVFDTGIVVFEKEEPGFSTPKEFAEFTQSETYADSYMQAIDLGGMPAVAWNRGTYSLDGGVGEVVLPSSVVTWWQAGVGHAVSSSSHDVGSLSRIARSMTGG